MMASPVWKERARQLKREIRALALAVRDPRVPWYAKLSAGLLVAYVFSPIDPIPDFIPVLGHLDELVVVPIAVLAIRRMIPADILTECRIRADAREGKPRSWAGAVLIVGLWLALAAASVVLFLRWFA
jgi:uncharacterized membrane protein YkvA (DUF1232 family)